MRIISYGHVKPRIQHCKSCGATYEYLPKDVESFRPGTSFARTFVRCPVCRNVTFINAEIVKLDDYTIFKEDKKNE